MSDQHPNHDYDDTQRIPAEPQVHRYPSAPGHGYGEQRFGERPYGGYAAPGPYRPYEQPQSTSRPSDRRGGLVTAGVLVAALLAGAVGGLAGAAGFEAVDGLDQDTTASSTDQGGSSTVIDREDTPPEAGSVEDVANAVLPSVVKINVRGPQGVGSGSGVILSPDGEILTNHHVVEVAEGGGSLSVNFNDGSSARARIVGTDPLTDLAVIQAEGVSGLTPAPLGESSNLDVGEQVVAVGSPYGLEATVTTGIVSALDRPVSISGSGLSRVETTYPAIQTDAAINPGNSGGPLLNMNGEVVGINSSIRTAPSSGGAGGSIGLGFAIPLDKVLPIVDQLRAGETPTHARLGVTVTDASSSDGLLTGAGIQSVTGGSAGDEAGLRSGDVVTRVNGDPVTGAESLVATIRGYRPGDTVTLTVVRDGDEEIELEVVLDSDEGAPAS